jgi:hypothetical protein
VAVLVRLTLAIVFVVDQHPEVLAELRLRILQRVNIVGVDVGAVQASPFSVVASVKRRLLVERENGHVRDIGRGGLDNFVAEVDHFILRLVGAADVFNIGSIFELCKRYFVLLQLTMDRPKLTKADLHDIKLRGRKNPDIVALLHEIKRLRGLVLRADQLQKMLGEMGGAQGLVLDSLRAELEDEPCVAEFPRLKAD